jgi:hypothetical protein
VEGLFEQAGTQSLRGDVEEDGFLSVRHRTERILDPAKLSFGVEEGMPRGRGGGDQNADRGLESGRERPGDVEGTDDRTLAAEIDELALVLAVEELPGERGEAAGFGLVRIEPQNDSQSNLGIILDATQATLEQVPDLPGEEGLE